MAWNIPDNPLDLSDTAQFMQAAELFGIDLTTDHQDKAKLILELASKQYDSERARIEATEKKAQLYFAGLIAGGGIILANHRAIFTHMSGPMYDGSHIARCVLFAIALVLWWHAMFCAYIALGIENYKGYPDIIEVLTRSRSQFVFHVREDLALTLGGIVSHNSHITSRKALRLRSAHFGVLISSLFIGIGCIDYAWKLLRLGQ